eukprot:365116-Chlamydomonas_euryale.AAC.12
MLRTLKDSLVLSVRSGLRWSGNLHKVGLYSGLLLSNGELSQLQQVLHSIPELQDDEKMLREVQDVFMTYVSSAEDELDETQFAQVRVLQGGGSEGGTFRGGREGMEGVDSWRARRVSVSIGREGRIGACLLSRRASCMKLQGRVHGAHIKGGRTIGRWTTIFSCMCVDAHAATA